MSGEPTLRQVACASEPRAASGVLPCPMCGGGLVPLRGLWRCSRCYFALCAGCEPATACEGADSSD